MKGEQEEGEEGRGEKKEKAEGVRLQHAYK